MATKTLSETKIKALMILIQSGKITLDSIKDSAYKEEVSNRLETK